MDWCAAHKEFLASGGHLRLRRQSKTKAELIEIIAERARSSFLTLMDTSLPAQKILAEVVDLSVDPHSAAKLLLQHWREKDQLK